MGVDPVSEACIDGTDEELSVFNNVFEDYFWNILNDGTRLVQVRLYPRSQKEPILSDYRNSRIIPCPTVFVYCEIRRFRETRDPVYGGNHQVGSRN